MIMPEDIPVIDINQLDLVSELIERSDMLPNVPFGEFPVSSSASASASASVNHSTTAITAPVGARDF